MTNAMLAGYWSLLLSLKAIAFLFPFFNVALNHTCFASEIVCLLLMSLLSIEFMCKVFW